MQTQTPLLTKKQAALYLNVSDGSIERLMRNGLKYIKVGGLVRFRIEDLAVYLDRHVRGGVAVSTFPVNIELITTNNTSIMKVAGEQS